MLRSPHLSSPVLLVAFLLGGRLSIAEDSQSLSGKDLQFFERRIRPVLVEHCYECHSGESTEVGGNLLLDTREGLLKGGETGPALVPGQSKQSLLLKALDYQGPEMPPDGKLPDGVIRDFREWIDRGAADPRFVEAAKTETGNRHYSRESLWSFQPRRSPVLPRVHAGSWPRDSIDFFVLSRMERLGLRPAEDAEPRTLARRLYYDLGGLPPTHAQVAAFESEFGRNPRAATRRLVDQLLASPRFGERWGQHWLDVARYGESNGDDGLGRNASFPHAWRYRDYVIDSLNRDVPYDRFLTEQVAGDLLEASTAIERNRNLVATGFLAIGAKPAAAMNSNFAMDVVDDQVNTLCTTVLGLSVACARCHDHKHDPISIGDYYSLAGIFASTETLYGLAANEKLTAPPTPLHPLYNRLPEGLPDFREAPKFPPTYAKAIQSLRPVIHESLASPGERLLPENQVKFSPEQYARFQPASALRGSFEGKPGSYSVSFWFKNETANTARPITVYLFSRGKFGDRTLLGDHLGIGGTHEADVTGKLFVFNGNVPNSKSVKGKTVVEAGTWNHLVFVRDREKVRFYLNGNPEAEFEGLLPDTVGDNGEFCLGERADQFAPLQGNLAQVALFDRALTATEAVRLHAESGQPRPQTSFGLAMGVRDKVKPADIKIHVNGSGARLGPVAPRGVMKVYRDESLVPRSDGQGITGPRVKWEDRIEGSGRRQLAAWLTHPDHPQTARVMVNRIWLHLMGRGIVETPDDFGVYGSRPSHPELLDHLADRFVAEGWSIKKLIRSIVLSRTYRLSSRASREVREGDSGNVWLTRHRRRRLDAEQIRDSILFASWNLKLVPGRGSDVEDTVALINWPVGESTNLHQPSFHRSIYLCRLRHAPPKELVAFDLPDGLSVVGQRSVSTSPAQSLFFVNSPFVVQQSRFLAESLLRTEADTGERIRHLYKRILTRSPSPFELQTAQEYVVKIIQQLGGSGEDSQAICLKAWGSLCQALFATNEFRYID